MQHLQALMVCQADVPHAGCTLRVLLGNVAQPQLQVARVVCQHLHRHNLNKACSSHDCDNQPGQKIPASA